jgi:hypothetical protein
MKSFNPEIAEYAVSRRDMICLAPRSSPDPGRHFVSFVAPW